ncbi:MULTISPECIES: hypothetical protein [unclassified Amycolatopsis]|uniref:hypothetical protein n=1 Tax=unclassified Amycolatopsis TaxID=2618356 RepID=UPI0018F4AA93|nr:MULTISPECIES: hypothetical protein [unclassified Amycolatopsis]
MGSQHERVQDRLRPEAVGKSVRELVVRSSEARPGDVIATLGPAGTSSEAAGWHLAGRLGIARDIGAVELFPSYEEARAAVKEGRASRLLVANAYQGISEFYMDRVLGLERAFVFDTPLYGLASRQDRPLPLTCQISTHPAPVALIGQLLPPGYEVAEVDYALSTSAAAERAANGEVDLALTTRPAAQRHGLRFISRTRPIRMLWSVFTRLPPGDRISSK